MIRLKVAIHQPNYLPWAGYFKKMAMADIFVILDTVQFSKDSYTQRTKIRTKDGWLWLTIPIEKEFNFKPIHEVRLPGDGKWLKKHWTSIMANYSKSEFYDGGFIEGLYGGAYHTLQELNEAGIFYLKEKLGIKTGVIRASSLGLDTSLHSTDLVVDIVKKAGGDIYISGTGGDNYQDVSKFEKAHIAIEYARFQPVEYSQRWNGFEPYMSAIDLLFNTGKEGLNMIKTNNNAGEGA
jgi:hypothetical protein